MGKLIQTVLSCCLLSVSLQPTAKASPETSPRFHLTNLDDLIAQKTLSLTILNRQLDPFGNPQDPNKKVIKYVKRSDTPTITEEKVLIREEINKLGRQVNTMGRRFLIGNRFYKRNDKIIIKVKGKKFPLKINSINKNKITFIDLSDNSLISLNLNNDSGSLGDPSGQPTLTPTDDGVIEVPDN